MLKLPTAFTKLPPSLSRCNEPSTTSEVEVANKIRGEYVIPGQAVPYMEDVVRAFRVAEGAKVYIEVGTQDRGNIAWLARTKLAKGATVIDIDMLDYPENEAKLKAEMQAAGFDYHSIRGDCLSDEVLNKVRGILNGRSADVIFCDSHYTYSHTLTEFTLYQPLVRPGGFIMFHDAQWPGDPAQEGEGGQKGKGLAIEQLDRFYPAWMVVGSSTPLHRALPIVGRVGHWGTLAVFPCGGTPEQPHGADTALATAAMTKPSATRAGPYRLRSPLHPFGKQVHSQTWEDGIIEAIFQDIVPRSRFFVEFGIGPNWQDPTYTKGIEGNCVLLRKNGWSGLFMDGGEHPAEFDIKREFVTPLNINSLFRKHGVPENVDLVSIDVDGQDLWIWMALDYRPSLVVIEMNPNFRTLQESVSVPFDPDFRWDTTKYYGASLGALIKLGKDKGYKLVYGNGLNCFFVRSDLLANPEDFNDQEFCQYVDQHIVDHLHRPWVKI